MTVEEYERSKNVQTVNIKKYIFNLVKRTLLSIILILSILIISKESDIAKDFIKTNLFQTNFKFSIINNLYDKYFLDIKEEISSTTVSNNNLLTYTNIKDYQDGAVLSVDENYNINLLNSGIVVFIGEKEGLGNTVIVQQSNGIDSWYGNVDNVDVKLYSYIEKGTIIGTANKKLYLSFWKDGKSIDYKTIIK